MIDHMGHNEMTLFITRLKVKGLLKKITGKGKILQ